MVSQKSAYKLVN